MRCEICHKTKMTGNNVSHSKRRTKTTFVANVHQKTLFHNGQNIRIKVCTRCLRSVHKSRRVARSLAAL
ncbi:MAG: 50S ribosomal protein L28 [SAR202 cluster bacterium]|nr:50S ribosomal protein L28 [SAR202 cluster bacterium]